MLEYTVIDLDITGYSKILHISMDTRISPRLTSSNEGSKEGGSGGKEEQHLFCSARIIITF